MHNYNNMLKPTYLHTNKHTYINTTYVYIHTAARLIACIPKYAPVSAYICGMYCTGSLSRSASSTGLLSGGASWAVPRPACVFCVVRTLIQLAVENICIHTYMHKCIHTCIYTYMQTYMHTCKHTYIYIYILYIHTYTDICIQHIDTYIHKYIRTCIIFMYVCICMFVYIIYKHTYIHTNMHTYIQTYIHTCIHTYMHTYITVAPYLLAFPLGFWGD